MAKYVDLAGDPIEPANLMISKARDLAMALGGGAIAYARLVECRRAGEIETVVFAVEVELGQLRAHPIRNFERVSASFLHGDDISPEVLALREDFPVVPHLNLRPFERPRSLCLYDEPYSDLKRRWTSARFVERIREWLALTAKGKLHAADQPLEPLLLDAIGTIVLPAALSKGRVDTPPEQLAITVTGAKPGEYFLLTHEPAEQLGSQGLRFVASVHRGVPQQHGIIRRKPGNLRELAEFVGEAGLDLQGELQARLRAWLEQSKKDGRLLDAWLALVLILPKTRSPGGVEEARDVWAFLSEEPIREIGRKLGVWDLAGGTIGLLLGDAPDVLGGDAQVHLLNPSFRLTRDDAAALNGRSAAAPVKIAAVGVGALGSQVIMNLARGGFGAWTLIDHDRLMPHNLGRHALNGALVGCNKAEGVAHAANTLFEEEQPFAHVVADVLRPDDKAEEVGGVLGGAEVILDMSASVTVARHLARGLDSPARRISLFLTPNGQDLVVLAEDRGRTIPLDSLEMQYYRAVATDEALAGHLGRSGHRVRYGRSCRDIASDIPQDQVALHAAIGSRGVRTVLADQDARIAIWRADDRGNVRRIDVEVAPAIGHDIAGWAVCTDATLVGRLAAIRVSKLPKETGGVLLGSFDLERRIIYVVDIIPSPPDSREWPTLYIRGCRGLKRKVEEIAERTDGMLEYIGEWHSHPKGCPTDPSPDDLTVLSWLAELMGADGLPAMMVIAGDDGHANYFVK